MKNQQLNLADYFDSTYLKTAQEAGISKENEKEIVLEKIAEAIANNFACIMIRPEFVSQAKEIIETAKSKVKVGTVIDFPLGLGSTDQKLKQAKLAIAYGAYDLDFVADFNAFKRGSFEKFDEDIVKCTGLVLNSKKVVKWIIETGALSTGEIRNISKRISKLVQTNFPQQANNVFIKTSTGYYGGYGATLKDIKTIKSVAGNLQIKASGGVSTFNNCMELLGAGATRIGTSKALFIFKQQQPDF
jgi:deoxyribose-phosphate aldolase